MNRERAKELLPIIQAYAEGKTIQYIGVGFENWHDVDNEFEIDSMRYKYRIKPESKYDEIFKLKKMLEKSFVPFEWKEFDNPSKQGFQILYPNDKNRVCSVIEHSFSYGNEKDLLEIQGLLTADEEECDSVLGNLTADDVFQRILSHWKETKEKTPCRPFKSCNELVYYWERKKVGYSVNPLLMIDIWVKHKVDGRRRMIVGFGENFVEVGVKAKPITLERLFEMYTFLDGSPCGVSNGEEESYSEN